MPPWTSRILSPNTRRDDAGHAISGTASAGPSRPPPRITEADILDNAYGIPTLPPSSSGNHTRSMSHPFPSLFMGKKHTTGKKNKGLGADSGDEGMLSSALAWQTIQNPTAKPAKVPDKELMTGKCMTCNSMVRWPKELNVFRCTVCLTINDLKPVVLEARRGDGQRAPVATKAAVQGSSPLSKRSRHSSSYSVLLQ